MIATALARLRAQKPHHAPSATAQGKCDECAKAFSGKW